MEAKGLWKPERRTDHETARQPAWHPDYQKAREPGR